MDGKRNYRCRIAANALFTARYGFSSYAIVHADALVWVADGRNFGFDHLYFHTDRSTERYFVRFLPGHHAERQRTFTHWYLPVAERCFLFRRAFGLKEKNIVRDRYDQNKSGR